MPAESEMATAFRSADESAEDDAQAIRDLLESEGIQAVLLDDSAPGVPEGVWEVQVPAADASRAEKLIAEAALPEQDMTDLDVSPQLATETVFRASAGTTAELEAMAVKSVLESNGVAALMVGDSVLPNLAFEVRVAAEHAQRARELIAEAEAAGPQAADEAEQSGEMP
jgi:Putative prokaryotic signal transducing protein